MLDTGVHFEVGVLCFPGIDVLCFWCPFPFFFVGGFGGAGDRRFGIDFGCARFWLNVGWLRFSYVIRHRFWGGLRFGVEDIVDSGFRSLFGGEVVELILCRYQGGVFSVGSMGWG